MINDKLITIKKDNQFNMGWTLFHPYDLTVSRNRYYQNSDVKSIVKKITYADNVSLILSEKCLSSRIVEELKWANKYIKINVIAKSDNIVKDYFQLAFSNIKIDANIDFNYIGIKGKENGYYMITDSYESIDDSIEKIYFENKTITKNLSFLANAQQVFIIGDKFDDFLEIIDYSSKKEIKCYIVTNSRIYNKKTFDFAKLNKVPLLISDYTRNGLVIINKDLSLTSANLTQKGFYVSFPVENINSFIGETFICGMYEDNYDLSKGSKDLFTCYNGRNIELKIEQSNTISIDCKINEMDDFINEKFDSSIVEKHNDYSNVSKKTIYEFTLIPPIFDNTYNYSNIYDEIKSLADDWIKLQNINTNKIIKEHDSFMKSDYGLINLLKFSEYFTDELKDKVKKYNYTNYLIFVCDALNKFNDVKDKLFDILTSMFNSINAESSETKFDKFDAEIEGYKKTINEKNAQIANGINVLENKRRVDILNSKIEKLLELKKHFEGGSDSRNTKALNDFINNCKKILVNGSTDKKILNDDSIGNIVKSKENSDIVKLNNFVSNYLFIISKYMNNCVEVLDKISNIYIPDDYVIYDKNNQRYIVIDDLKEYEDTRVIRDEFNIKCLARR